MANGISQKPPVGSTSLFSSLDGEALPFFEQDLPVLISDSLLGCKIERDQFSLNPLPWDISETTPTLSPNDEITARLSLAFQFSQAAVKTNDLDTAHLWLKRGLTLLESSCLPASFDAKPFQILFLNQLAKLSFDNSPELISFLDQSLSLIEKMAKDKPGSEVLLKADYVQIKHLQALKFIQTEQKAGRLSLAEALDRQKGEAEVYITSLQSMFNRLPENNAHAKAKLAELCLGAWFEKFEAGLSLRALDDVTFNYQAHYQEACEELKSARVRLDSSLSSEMKQEFNARELLAQAEFYFRAGNPEDSIQLLKDLKSKYPDTQAAALLGKPEHWSGTFEIFTPEGNLSNQVYNFSFVEGLKEAAGTLRKDPGTGLLACGVGVVLSLALRGSANTNLARVCGAAVGVERVFNAARHHREIYSAARVGISTVSSEQALLAGFNFGIEILSYYIGGLTSKFVEKLSLYMGARAGAPLLSRILPQGFHLSSRAQAYAFLASKELAQIPAAIAFHESSQALTQGARHLAYPNLPPSHDSRTRPQLWANAWFMLRMGQWAHTSHVHRLFPANTLTPSGRLMTESLLAAGSVEFAHGLAENNFSHFADKTALLSLDIFALGRGQHVVERVIKNTSVGQSLDRLDLKMNLEVLKSWMELVNAAQPPSPALASEGPTEERDNPEIERPLVLECRGGGEVKSNWEQMLVNAERHLRENHESTATGLYNSVYKFFSTHGMSQGDFEKIESMADAHESESTGLSITIRFALYSLCYHFLDWNASSSSTNAKRILSKLIPLYVTNSQASNLPAKYKDAMTWLLQTETPKYDPSQLMLRAQKLEEILPPLQAGYYWFALGQRAYKDGKHDNAAVCFKNTLRIFENEKTKIPEVIETLERIQNDYKRVLEIHARGLAGKGSNLLEADPSAAMGYFEKALYVYEKLGDPKLIGETKTWIAIALTNLAIIDFTRNRYSYARVLLDKAERLLNETDLNDPRTLERLKTIVELRQGINLHDLPPLSPQGPRGPNKLN